MGKITLLAVVSGVRIPLKKSHTTTRPRCRHRAINITLLKRLVCTAAALIMFVRARSPQRGAAAGPSAAVNAANAADEGNDDNDDTGAYTGTYFDSDLRASVTRNSESDKALYLVHEAYEYVERRVRQQVDAAVESNAPNNIAVPGDSSTKTAFYTLLNRNQQRLLFLDSSKTERTWPRLRSLFGAPPYGFLHIEDASGLRAGGIAKRRANMAHNIDQIVPNYNQFGAGHFADTAGRLYNVVALTGSYKEADAGDYLPWTKQALRDAVRIVMVARIPKHRVSKLRASSSNEAKVLFPNPGQTIRLQMTSVLDQLSDPTKRQPFASQRATSELAILNVRIHTVSLRAMHASTAVVSAVIV